MRACSGTPRDKSDVWPTAWYPGWVIHLVKGETPCGSLTCKKDRNEEYACLEILAYKALFTLKSGGDDHVVLTRWLV